MNDLSLKEPHRCDDCGVYAACSVYVDLERAGHREWRCSSCSKKYDEEVQAERARVNLRSRAEAANNLICEALDVVGIEWITLPANLYDRLVGISMELQIVAAQSQAETYEAEDAERQMRAQAARRTVETMQAHHAGGMAELMQAAE